MEYKMAKRMAGMQESDVREILKITQRPEVISFAGGLPAPELFPIEEIKVVANAVLEESGQKALQYTTTEGYEPLRAWVAARMNQKLGTSFNADNVMITHGSQQAIDLTGKVFLDEGDVVLCESPTYLAALSAFRAYGCNFVEVATDGHGMQMEDLEEKLASIPNVKLVYVITEFQNPTGRSWNLERRKAFAQITAKYGVVVLEDNPYGELRFEGETLPSVKAFDTTGNIFCTGTFSKIFCPGYRIGWIAGEESVIEQYITVKQGTDLQCNTLAQMEIVKYLEMYDIDKHIEKIRKTYRVRRDVMFSAMEKYFPKEAVFTRPEGGLFAWVVLPSHINAREVLIKCLEQEVAFVPGGSFYPSEGKENSFRVNYSNMPEDKIVVGIERLGRVLHEFLAK